MRSKCLMMFLPLLLLLGCKGFEGEETNIDFIDQPSSDARSVAYVPIQPALDQLQYPTDVFVGFDELLYVVDEGAEKIIAYDLAGTKLGEKSIPGVKSATMDRKLDILAIGTFDTIIGNSEYSLSTIYRLNLKNSSYGLSGARITNKIVHPFYYRSNFSEADALASFNGVAVLSDNGFYATRSGTRNSVSQFGGPDDAVLEFTNEDVYLTPITITTETGLRSDFFQQPKSILTQFVPPQTTLLAADESFFVTSVAPNRPLKIHRVAKISSDNGLSFRLAILSGFDPNEADGYIDEPYRFIEPADVTLSGDGSNYVFVVDAQKDSLYQFTFGGLEGVVPPPGSQSTKLIKVSFGGNGNGLTQFNEPRGVAYFDEIVYVADAGNGRVLRFRLTTDFE